MVIYDFSSLNNSTTLNGVINASLLKKKFGLAIDLWRKQCYFIYVKWIFKTFNYRNYLLNFTYGSGKIAIFYSTNCKIFSLICSPTFIFLHNFFRILHCWRRVILYLFLILFLVHFFLYSSSELLTTQSLFKLYVKSRFGTAMRKVGLKLPQKFYFYISPCLFFLLIPSLSLFVEEKVNIMKLIALRHSTSLKKVFMIWEKLIIGSFTLKLVC